jgi:5,10-methylenetetrahydromethanopterin reductase
MSTTATRAPTELDDALDPVVSDLSAYLAGGRVWDSGEVIRQAVDAERLGLRRVWLSERYDLKEAGVLLGGMAASTTRLEMGTAALIPSSRPPIVVAAMGATLHSAFGPRLTLGLGRSMSEYISNANLEPVTRRALIDYADIYRRLWRGETVDYDGPAGSYSGLHMADTYDGDPPQVWAVHLGGPKACEMSGSPAFDGVYLQPFMTAEAVSNSVELMRRSCERHDRDPASLRICIPLVSAPEMTPDQERLLMHARMITYIGQPSMMNVYTRLNGWDPERVRPILDHPMFADDPDRIDHNFHREQLAEVAKMVPDEWMYPTSLSGSIADCVETMQDYRDTGADEISFYGSSPAENAKLIAAWREHSDRRDS